jgi:metallo-beta-lactamase class B
MMRFAAVLLVMAGWGSAAAQYAPAVPEWNRPVEPFRIVGDLYYVGASDVSSFLIATPAGHVLLDSGFRETAPLVEANVKKLGFRLEDVRILLISHSHYDHVGGMAEIKAHTKARLLASPAEAEMLARGGRGDFAFDDKYPYPPVTADGLLREGQEVRLGNAVLTAHFTPGHTRGCTSWSTTFTEGGRVYQVVIACSVTAPGYRLVGNPRYPGILQDFEATFAKLRALPCDIFLSLHSWDFGLERKMHVKAVDAFVDREGWLAFLDKGQAAIRKQAMQ